MSEIKEDKKVAHDSSTKEFFGERVDERRLFSKDEKKIILNRTGNICAACGKKLNLKTMTVEHIIPLSRGGKNELKNLISLCPECNKLKGNLFYFGTSYYGALYNKRLVHEIFQLSVDWFNSVKHSFDIKKYPFISPCMGVELQYTDIAPKAYSRNTFIDIHYVNKGLYDEVQAVTNLSLDTNKVYYVIKRRNSDKLLALLEVYRTDTVLVVKSLWDDIKSKKLYAFVLWTLCQSTLYMYYRLGLDFKGYSIVVNDESLNHFLKQRMPEDGIENAQIYHVVAEGESCKDYIFVTANSNRNYLDVINTTIEHFS